MGLFGTVDNNMLRQPANEVQTGKGLVPLDDQGFSGLHSAPCESKPCKADGEECEGGRLSHFDQREYGRLRGWNTKLAAGCQVRAVEVEIERQIASHTENRLEESPPVPHGAERVIEERDVQNRVEEAPAASTAKTTGV